MPQDKRPPDESPSTKDKQEKQVTNLSDKREDKELERLNKRRLSWGDIVDNVQLMIDRSPLTSFHFTRLFKVVCHQETRKIVAIDDDTQVCHYVDIDTVAGELLRFLQSKKKLALVPEYQMSFEKARRIVKVWEQRTKPIPMPELVRFQNDFGFCFSRLPWDFDPEAIASSPHWDELLGRMSDPHAVMDYIGSLFDPTSYRQQYLYLYGDGLDGKGTLCRFLARCFGNGAVFLNNPVNSRGQLSDSHWTQGIVGKRLGIFDDLSLFNMVSSSFFKMITGTNYVPVNPKGLPAYTAEIGIKFIITANRLPVIDGSSADLRRALICSLERPKELWGPDYEDRLWDEGGAFLSRCIAGYRERYPRGGAIAGNAEIAKEIAEDREVFFRKNLEMCFEFGDDFEIPRHRFAEVLYEAGLSSNKISDMKHFLKRYQSVTEAQRRVGDNRVKVYKGIREKPGGWLK